MSDFQDGERDQEWAGELIIEGESCGLTTATAREILHHARAHATDRFGRVDETRARLRFHELAAFAARRGGRLRRDPGKGAAIGEHDDEDILNERAPGKVTLVELEERRLARQERGAAIGVPGRITLVELEQRRRARQRQGEQPRENELPYEHELAALRDASRAGRASGSMHEAPEPHDQTPLALKSSPVDVPYRAQMETFFGASFADARAHLGEDLALAPHGARGAAFDSTVVFASGDPGPDVVAHELAHLAQHKAVGDPGPSPQPWSGPGDTAEVEAETAAAVFTAGGAGMRVTAQPSAAVSFDRGSTSAVIPGMDAAQGKATHQVPGPIALDVVGDRFEFEVVIVDAVPHMHIQYIGPERTRLSSLGQSASGTIARHVRVPLIPMHLPSGGATLGWSRPLQARAIGRTADAVTFDLYGDGTAILEVQDQTDASTLDARAHTMWLRINRKWAASSAPKFEVQLPPPVGGKRDPSGQHGVIVPLTLNGDHFELGARKFGDTNQMLLAIRGDRGHTEVLVPIVGELRNPGLRILSNDGRNISIDLDGDGCDDATVIHTVIPTGAKPAGLGRDPDIDADSTPDPHSQTRNHYLEVYDANAIRVGQLIGQATGHPIAIPPEQDHNRTPPPQGEAQPGERAPVQGDVPAEQALAIKHTSRDWELRFDGNGDRSKELLLRVVPQGPAVYGQPRTYQLSLTNLDTHQTAGGMAITLTSEQWQWFDLHGPQQTIASDGVTAPRISLVPERHAAPLTIELQRWPDDPPWYQAYVHPGNQSHAFFVDATPPTGALASGGGDVHKVAGVLSTELILGEYGDRFRFTVEESPRPNFAIVFSVTAIGPGPHIGGVGFHLAGRRATALRLHSVSATSVAWDTTGSGTPDLFVYDAISAPLDELVEAPNQLKMPQHDRDHRIRIVDHHPDRGPHAPQIAPEPYTFRIRGGQLVTGYDKGGAQRLAAGAGQSVGLLAEQGALLPAEAALDKTSILQAQIDIDTALLGAAAGVLSRPEHTERGGTSALQSWSQLHEDMIYVQAQRRHGVEPSRVTSARTATGQILDWLRVATTPTADTQTPQNASTNPYTGETTVTTTDPPPRVADPRKRTARHWTRIVDPAYGDRLISALVRGDYEAALASYSLVAKGFYRWIRDQLEKSHGSKSSEVKQLDHFREMDPGLSEIGQHTAAFRVPATFIADASYSRKDGFASYRTIPMQVFVWREGATWHIRDLTNSATRPWKGSAAATDYAGDRPPGELFQQLNHPRAYPKGVIRYHLPDGRDGNATNDGGAGDSVDCDEHKTWEQHLSELALVLGAIGLAAATGGLGLLATVAFAGSAAVGIGAVGARLDDAHEHGYMTDGMVWVSVVEIAQNLASLGVLSAGKVISGAATAARGGGAWSGGAARIAQIARAAYRPLVATEVATTGTMLLVMTTEVIDQLEQLDKTVPEGERNAARARLLGQFAVMGGLMVLSIRGELPSIWQRSPIVIDTVNGLPVARAANVEVSGQRVDLDRADADTHATARWTSADLDDAARQDPASPRGAAARNVLETKEGRAAIAKWLGQDAKLGPDGHIISPDGTPPEVVAALQRYADTTNLAITERAFATADELAAVRAAGDGLDLNPLAPTWSSTRDKLIEVLGGDGKARRLVAVYERARSGVGAEDLGAFVAQRAAITQFVPESELERVRRFYPDGDVYLSGNLARPGSRFDPTAVVEVTVVAPDGTTPELMYAMEQRLEGHRLHPDIAFLKAKQLSVETSVPVRARVVTADQFFGLTVTSGAGAFHKLDSTMPDLVGGGRVRAVGHNEYAADAGDLAIVRDSWKTRGGTESVSVIHYDSNTNTSHFEVAVGHGRGRQRLRITAHLESRITDVAGLRNGENQVVGNPIRNLRAAHDFLRELRDLNVETFAKIGVDVPAGTRLDLGDEVEYALGRTSNNEYVVVMGTRHAVSWARLPGLEPVAHTHPSVAGNHLRADATGAERIALTELAGPSATPLVNRELVCPSTADFGLVARKGIDDHRVFTPFVVRDGFVVKPEAGEVVESRGRLEFIIRKPREVGHMPGNDPGIIVYRATLVGEVDSKVVMRAEVWAAQEATGGGHLFMEEPKGMLSRSPARPVASKRSIGDGLAPGATLYTVRANLEKAIADQLATFKQPPAIEVMYADEFVERFGSEQARAIFRPGEHGTGVIYARPDARPFDILGELVHARQMDDPKLRAEILRLDAGLDRSSWNEFSPRDRLGYFRCKLEIEIDAHQRMKRDAGAYTDGEMHEIAETLGELRRLEREVSMFSEQQISDMSAGLLAMPQYLESPPWLASKVRRIDGRRPDRSAAYKEDAPLVVVAKDGPSRSAAYNTRENVRTVSRVGDEWTEATHVIADHTGIVSIRMTDKRPTVVITTQQGEEYLYPVEKGTSPRVTEGQQAEPGIELAVEKRRYRQVRIDLTDNTSDVREEILRLNGDGWVQRGSETTRRAAIMETAARMQIDARIKAQGVEGARRIEHQRGGGGFDDVIVFFSGSAQRPMAKILIREVKGHIDDYAPLQEFSAIRPPGLSNNLDTLSAKMTSALENLDNGQSLPPDLQGLTGEQIGAIRTAIAKNSIEIEVVLGPRTKLGRESAKGASVLRDLRREINSDRGRDVLVKRSDESLERIDSEYVNQATKMEKDAL